MFVMKKIWLMVIAILGIYSSFLGAMEKGSAKQEATPEDVTQWFKAIKQDDCVLLEKLITETSLGCSSNNDTSIDVRDGNGLSGLMVAIFNANIDAALLLLEAGADVFATVPAGKTYCGLTPLGFSIGRISTKNVNGVQFDQSKMIMELLARGVEHNAKFSFSITTVTKWGGVMDWRNKTPLMYYAAHVPYHDGWDVLTICEHLSHDVSTEDLGEAFKLACHKPDACSNEVAFDYAIECLRIGKFGGVNPLVVYFLAEKLGVQASAPIID